MYTQKLQIKGIVQGVGFRPFIYNLALKYDIKGWVNNDDKGVNVLLYCSKESFEKFIKELKKNPPPLAKIDSIKIKQLKSKKKFRSFDIINSKNSNNKSTIISPDIAVCKACIEDINDKKNFRYNYALTNCTNCGPRYSIIKTVPYDRINTSMAEFILCEKCKKEYEDPTNRRYHAQPVSCEDCGPIISLHDKNNKKIASNILAIEKTANLIKEGKILAIKGLGGFHLVCDVSNKEVIKELRVKKNRPSKPFAIMFKNIEQINKYTNLEQKEQELLESKEKPIVLVKKSPSTLHEELAPKIDRLGCFIVYTPLHHLLFRYLEKPIVATSANLKDEPIIRFKDEIFQKLFGVVDFVLDYNREIINACDDSVVQVINEEISILRNARGYAPNIIKIHKSIDKKILALGANQKATISFIFEDNLVSSPHIGDLSSIEAFEYFQRTIETFKRFYDFEPEIIVCDKHPNYMNTKWAKTFKNKKVVQIQHHYAHLLSTMAEYKLKQKVLGFVFDGTGYGDDGKIWGGEVFICDNKEYERKYHFKYFKLLGGELAIKEPKRVALSLLFDNFSLKEVLSLDVASVKAFSKKELEVMYKIWEKGLNSPLTSSLGRIFDAVASLSGIIQIQSYEGETGLLVEQFYNGKIKEAYSYNLDGENIDISLAIKELVKEKNKEMICSKFLNMLVNIVVDISDNHKNLSVILSGGVFQNKTLLELIIKKFDSLNKKYYYSKKVPLNDGGISIGQAYSQVD